jgi:hypothetical protein
MKLMRYVTLITLLISQPVMAADAWIKWIHIEEMGPGLPRQNTWQIGKAYSTLDQCKADNNLNGWTEGNSLFIDPASGKSYKANEPKPNGTLMMTWFCYPDTIDPRK